MLIAGFDPGSKNFGIGLIKGEANNIHFLAAASISLNSKPRSLLFQNLWQELADFYQTYQFEIASLEEGFLGKSPAAFGILEQLRGLCIGFFISRKIPFFLYQSRLVKKVVTGYGNASKEQVGRFLPKIINGINRDLSEDESDALALALTHYFQNK